MPPSAKVKTKAVFLDRDGTINKEIHHLRDVKQLRILPGAAHAIKQINRLGFLVIILTNQSVIGHGLSTEKKVDHIHAVLRGRLRRNGANIDAIYYCPHHPKAKLKKYRMYCSCRKPGIALIQEAAKTLKIDLKKSFMVGDKTGDILAGKRAKLKTILVQTGYAGKDNVHDVTPDFIAKNLAAAVKIISSAP